MGQQVVVPSDEAGQRALFRRLAQERVAATLAQAGYAYEVRDETLAVPPRLAFAPRTQVRSALLVHVLRAQAGWVSHPDSQQTAEFTLEMSGPAAADSFTLDIRNYRAVDCPTSGCSPSIAWPAQVPTVLVDDGGPQYAEPDGALGALASNAFLAAIVGDSFGTTLPFHVDLAPQAPCQADAWVERSGPCDANGVCRVLASRFTCAPAGAEFGNDARLDLGADYEPMRLVVVETQMSVGRTPTLGIRTEIHQFTPM